MPRVAGQYSLPPGYLAVSGETITPSQHNAPMEDIAQALTDSLPRDGSASMTGNLPMNGNRITGLGAATADSHALRRDQAILRQGYLASASAIALGANEMLYASGADTAAKTALTPFARSLLDDADAATARGTLGAASAVIGIAAGDGLTGGGNLSANRSLAVDGSVVRTSRTISTGNGLTGGGDLGANRTISMGTPGTITTGTSNAVQTGSHTHNLDLSGVSVRAGNGLTGGGDLSASRTITLGNPSSITATSTNSVSGNTHTHAISAATIRSLISDGAHGQVGSYALLRYSGTAGATPGTNYPASDFSGYGSGGGTDSTGSVSGTWKAMGHVQSGNPSQRVTLFLRVA